MARICFTVCRRKTSSGKHKKGEFMSCGTKRKTRKGKKARKASKAKARRKVAGAYRDKGGMCRVKGKKGFAKESVCKRAGK